MWIFKQVHFSSAQPANMHATSKASLVIPKKQRVMHGRYAHSLFEKSIIHWGLWQPAAWRWINHPPYKESLIDNKRCFDYNCRGKEVHSFCWRRRQINKYHFTGCKLLRRSNTIQPCRKSASYRFGLWPCRRSRVLVGCCSRSNRQRFYQCNLIEEPFSL